MMRTELARVTPLLRDVEWPLLTARASRWSAAPNGDLDDAIPADSLPPAPPSVPPSSGPSLSMDVRELPPSSSRDLDDPDASGARPLPPAGRFDLPSAFDDIPWSDCRAANTG